MSPWPGLFLNWPKDLPRRGVVVTRQNEASPFKGFMTRSDFVLIERESPDALGARYLLLPFTEIACVKFITPLQQSTLQAAGFVGAIS